MGTCQSCGVAGERITDVLEGYPQLAGCIQGAPGVFASRTAAHDAGQSLILEGFLVHHGAGRRIDVRDTGARVLAGDACYAEGLVRIADDLEQVSALAGVIMAASAAMAGGNIGIVGDIWAQAADSTMVRAALEGIG